MEHYIKLSNTFFEVQERLSVEFRSLSVESLDFSKQRYNSFMRFEKGFLGKFGENFAGLPGI